MMAYYIKIVHSGYTPAMDFIVITSYRPWWVYTTVSVYKVNFRERPQ